MPEVLLLQENLTGNEFRHFTVPPETASLIRITSLRMRQKVL